MRSPYIESRDRADGTTGYRVKWETPDPTRRRGVRTHSFTFDDDGDARVFRDALAANDGDVHAAATALRHQRHQQEPTP